MFGKDAECSSVEATSLLFSAGAEPRRPGLCAQRSCTPLLCKLKADRMSAWRTAHKPVFRFASTFLEPLEVHRSRPRAIEVQSSYDAND